MGVYRIAHTADLIRGPACRLRGPEKAASCHRPHVSEFTAIGEKCDQGLTGQLGPWHSASRTGSTWAVHRVVTAALLPLVYRSIRVHGSSDWITCNYYLRLP